MTNLDANFADQTAEEAANNPVPVNLDDEQANQAAGQAVSDALTPQGNEDDTTEEIRSTGDNGLDALKRDFLRRVGKLGADEALGKDALPKLFIEVAQAAADGLVTVGKKGEKDDADIAYDRYLANRTRKAEHEQSKDSRKVQVSKLRTAIRAGGWPKGDFMPVLHRAKEIHKAMIDAGEKVVSAYPAYVKVAITQTPMDVPMTDDELRECMLKAEPEEKTIQGELERAHKILEDLVTGEGKHGLKTEDENVIKAEEMLRSAIATLVQKAELQKLIEKAAALGYQVAAPSSVVTH